MRIIQNLFKHIIFKPSFYQQIFDLNKVDRAQFYKQIEYLEGNPVEFKVLMDSVNELSKREKKPL